jgi:hypothetical protein
MVKCIDYKARFIVVELTINVNDEIEFELNEQILLNNQLRNKNCTLNKERKNKTNTEMKSRFRDGNRMHARDREALLT